MSQSAELLVRLLPRTVADRMFVPMSFSATVLGGLLVLVGGIPWFGRLPGDVSIDRDNFHIYAPITSMLLLSLVLTIAVNLFARR